MKFQVGDVVYYKTNREHKYRVDDIKEDCLRIRRVDGTLSGYFPISCFSLAYDYYYTGDIAKALIENKISVRDFSEAFLAS